MRTANLLENLLGDSDEFNRWKDEIRTQFANEIGPFVMEKLRAQEECQPAYEPVRDRIVFVYLMAEALGEVLAVCVTKSSPKELQERMFVGMAEQLKICGLDFLDFLERNGSNRKGTSK